jgi:hypothetical protein
MGAQKRCVSVVERDQGTREEVTRVVFVWLGWKEQFPYYVGGLGFKRRAKKVRVGGGRKGLGNCGGGGWGEVRGVRKKDEEKL